MRCGTIGSVRGRVNRRRKELEKSKVVSYIVQNDVVCSEIGVASRA